MSREWYPGTARHHRSQRDRSLYPPRIGSDERERESAVVRKLTFAVEKEWRSRATAIASFPRFMLRRRESRASVLVKPKKLWNL